MSRPRSKQDLLIAAEKNYQSLNQFIDQMSEKELQTEFDFSMDANKKEAHWKRDKNLRDVLIHLYEWQKLLLAFVENNRKRELNVAFLPSQYSWKTYGEMNVEIWKKHQMTTLEQAKQLLEDSHRKIVSLAESFSDEELFTKKFFKWTGTTDLGSYFVSTTSSHYDWALKKLKEHRKKCK